MCCCVDGAGVCCASQWSERIFGEVLLRQCRQHDPRVPCELSLCLWPPLKCLLHSMQECRSGCRACPEREAACFPPRFLHDGTSCEDISCEEHLRQDACAWVVKATWTRIVVHAASNAVSLRSVRVLSRKACATLHRVAFLQLWGGLCSGAGRKMTPAMRPKICSPKCEGRLSAFTLWGANSGPEDGPLFGVAFRTRCCERVKKVAFIMGFAFAPHLLRCTLFLHMHARSVKARSHCSSVRNTCTGALLFIPVLQPPARGVRAEPTAAATFRAHSWGALRFIAPCGQRCSATLASTPSCARGKICTCRARTSC